MNFWKAWTFLMGVSISNKEYNFFIISETVMWQFFYALLSSNIFQLSWIHLASLRRQGRLHICICKIWDLKPCFVQPQPPRLSFFVSRTQHRVFLILLSKIWSMYTTWNLLDEDVESFFLTKHCYYNKLYLQRASKGHQ